ncbi:MAG: PIN domain-containing protein [Armatimonadetes bacterium]|nr:PIN domain-containing protein [Armatimonadota bacterium]
MPTVALLELAYLEQVGRLNPDEIARVRARLLSPGGALAPLDFGVAAALHAGNIPRAVSTDPFDRMVAGTALAAGLPLITADTKLRDVPGLTVIW